VFISLYLRLKKENLLTADDKGLTLIHADAEKRDRNNSDARFELTSGIKSSQQSTTDGATEIALINLR
jgi:hypothetical protein